MSSLRPLTVSLCLLSGVTWGGLCRPTQAQSTPQILQPTAPAPVGIPQPDPAQSLTVPALRTEIRRLRLEMLDVLNDLEDLERQLETNPTPIPFFPTPQPTPSPTFFVEPTPVSDPSPSEPVPTAPEDQPGPAPAPAPAPAPGQSSSSERSANPISSVDLSGDPTSAQASEIRPNAVSRLESNPGVTIEDSEASAALTSDPEPIPSSEPDQTLDTTARSSSPTPSPALEEITALQAGTQTLSLPGDVLFNFDESEIRPEAALLLQEVANQIIELSRARIIVEGHTDSVGDEAYNQALSLARANAVKRYLAQIIPDQDNYSWLTKGAGSSQPIASNTTSAGRQQNRRVDLIIAP